MIKLPSGFDTAVARLQTGTPSAQPFSDVGLPSLSKICHATEPPLAQAVPSVQASNTSSRAFATATGCLAFVSGDTGDDTFPVLGSNRTKKALPCVSAAARIPVCACDKKALLMGQAATFHW